MTTDCVENYENEVSTEFYSEEILVNYVKEIMKYPNLTIEEEQEAARLSQNGDEESKQKIIRANLKLVVIIAKKVIHSSKLPMIDLIQEGNIGLMAAVDKFNWKYGFRFSTYASWWIKQAMFKAISEQSHSLKIPVYIQETLSKYSKIKHEVEKASNKTADIEDVAKRMNISPSKISNYLNANKITLSLEADYELKNGSKVKLSEIIEDEKNSVAVKIERDNLKRDIVNLLNKLKDREKRVIILRFGLEGDEKQTLEEIGNIYGVTKECIRQTEARALNKLRNYTQTEILYNDYFN